MIITKIVIDSKTKHFQKQPQLFSEMSHQKLQKKRRMMTVVPVRLRFISGGTLLIKLDFHSN
jgi:hypothetical protein